MMAMLSQTPVEKLQNFFVPETDYPTPKVDVRGYVLNEKKEFLMVKESVDCGWTLPGGWADIGQGFYFFDLIEEFEVHHCKF